MITINKLTKQEYDNIGKTPNSQFCFFENEKNICKIISTHFADTIQQNINTLKMFLPFDKTEVYEIVSEKRNLYLINQSV